jgi:dihydroorotate dehydrogenase (fumarate)
VAKMLMAGAKVTMLASVLLKEGIDHLHTIKENLIEWMDQNDYVSVADMQGIVSQFHSKDPSAFERTEYIRSITSFGQEV